jgi:predicted RNA-binding protein YlxR (DUF448 family)
MMISVVYHGSYTKIDEINLSFCHKGRDFGRGFYVTKIRSQAEYWAARKGKWRNTQGAVTEFGLHEELIRILKLKTLRFEGYTEEWLDFIVLNRDNSSEQQAHDYDMVEGPVADDEVATRMRDYIIGNITKEQFLSELTYKTSTHQMCFCTKNSLNVLITQKDKMNGIFADIDDEIVNALMMDSEIDETEAIDTYYTSKTFTQLANESTELYKKPWQEIYEMLKTELNDEHNG